MPKNACSHTLMAMTGIPVQSAVVLAIAIQ